MVILEAEISFSWRRFFKFAVKLKFLVNFFNLRCFEGKEIWHVDVEFNPHIVFELLFFTQESIGACIFSF